MKTEIVDGIEVVRTDVNSVPDDEQPCRWCVFRRRHHHDDCPADQAHDWNSVCKGVVFVRPLDYATFRLTGVPEEY